MAADQKTIIQDGEHIKEKLCANILDEFASENLGSSLNRASTAWGKGVQISPC